MKNVDKGQEFRKDFEERLLRFSVAVVELSRKLRADRVLFVVVDQLLRAATSIGANVLEARGAQSKRDYLNFFAIALKSANETKYWLRLVAACRPDLQPEIQGLLSEATEIANILGASVLTMQGRRTV